MSVPVPPDGPAISECALCNTARGVSVGESEQFLYTDEHWLVRSFGERGVPGWVLVQSRRHVAGIWEFDDAEAADLGPALRWMQAALKEITGAERIYTASLNESSRHFHCHLVPRYAAMPRDAVGWDVFSLLDYKDDVHRFFPQEAWGEIRSRYRQALSIRPS